MTLGTREKQLLAVLAVLAGVMGLRMLYHAVTATPELPAAAAPEASSARSAARAARPGGSSVATRFPTTSRKKGRRDEPPPHEVFTLRLADLEISPRDFSTGRDLFRFGPPPPPPGPTPEELARMQREEIERRKREAEEAARRAEAAAREAAIPKPPPVDLTYLGSFGPQKRRVAVFADQAGERLFNAREGDVVEGKFIVDRIGYESVDLKFVGFPKEPAKRLALGG